MTSRLKRLKLGKNNLSHSGLNTNHTYITKLIEYGFFNSLEQLSINYCQLGDENIIRIAAHLSLGKCPSLRSLDCSGNKITRKGSTAIAKGLKVGYSRDRCSKLHLNIENNNISKQVFRQIAEYLIRQEVPSKSSSISKEEKGA